MLPRKLSSEFHLFHLIKSMIFHAAWIRDEYTHFRVAAWRLTGNEREKEHNGDILSGGDRSCDANKWSYLFALSINGYLVASRGRRVFQWLSDKKIVFDRFYSSIFRSSFVRKEHLWINLIFIYWSVGNIPIRVVVGELHHIIFFFVFVVCRIRKR